LRSRNRRWCEAEASARRCRRTDISLRAVQRIMLQHVSRSAEPAFQRRTPRAQSEP
jgi:hypothetical protein